MSKKRDHNPEHLAAAPPGWFAGIRFHLGMFRGKLGRDIFWNWGSIVLLGLAGVSINIVIGRFYDAAVLGVFNQVFAIYMITAQAASGGLPFSVLKYASEHADHRETVRGILSSALFLGVLSGAAWSAALFAGHDLAGRLLDSPGVAEGLAVVAPAVACTVVNRILMVALNASRRMKLFAIIQAVRVLAILSFIVVASLCHMPGPELPLAFVAAEALALLALAAAVFRRVPPALPRRWNGWTRRHLRFAPGALASSLLIDANALVDILMLGLFCSDRQVGAYAFAASLVQGLEQLAAVVQQNVNPLLVRLSMRERRGELRELVKKIARGFRPVVGALALAGWFIYPLVVDLLAANPDMLEGRLPYAVRAAGLVAASGHLPFMLLFSQAGRPDLNAWLLTATVLGNILLNGLFIPFWGPLGAAVATAFSCILGVYCLKIMTRKLLGVRI